MRKTVGVRSTKGQLLALLSGGAILVAACWQLYAIREHYRTMAAGSECRRNLEELSQAILLYAADHDDRLPQAAHWQDGVAPSFRKTGGWECAFDRRPERA